MPPKSYAHHEDAEGDEDLVAIKSMHARGVSVLWVPGRGREMQVWGWKQGSTGRDEGVGGKGRAEGVGVIMGAGEYRQG
eukprot:173676-Chlamydomonas_euryale.AAC.4